MVENGSLSEGNGAVNWTRGWLRLWIAATLLWIIAFAAVLIAAPDVAWRLRGPGTETVALPPCGSGQLACDPWERKWEEGDIPAGAIFGPDNITLPGPFSPGPVAAVALGPPAAVLVLGWLLGWVAAGFARTPARK